MKTKYLFAALLVFVVIFAGYSTELPKMSITPVDNQKAVIAFESKIPTLFEITIRKANSDIVYYKNVDNHTTVYNEVFDFSGFAKGKYCVSVNYGNQSVNREVTVSKNNFRVSNSEMLFEPYFHFKHDKLNVSFLNISGEKVKIELYRNNDLLSSVDCGGEICIQKSLDLRKLEKGNYKVVLNEKLSNHIFMVQK